MSRTAFACRGAIRSALLRLLAALLPALLAGCVSPPERVDAAAETEAAKDPAAMSRIGNAAAASGDDATAAAFYGRAAQLQPDDADTTMLYARSLVGAGRSDEAIAALRSALSHAGASDRSRLSAALGKLLILTHQPAEAVSVFRDALGQGPVSPGLLIGLGVALDASRDAPAAQEAYRRALAAEPYSVAAGNNLALSIALQGDPSQALADLTVLRSRVAGSGGRSSDLATIDGNLALVYAMLGNLRQAGKAGAGAAQSIPDLASNMRFYSALAPDGTGSGPASGLIATEPGD